MDLLIPRSAPQAHRPRTRLVGEKLFSVLLGLTFLGWAAPGIISARDLEPVRLLLTALQILVGVQLLRRSPCRRAGSTAAVLISAPSVAVGGLALLVARPVAQWHLAIEVVFLAGTAFVALTFLFLSRNFAILPAVRDIVESGPYRVLRHPAYAGELLMVGACAAAAEHTIGYFVLPLAVGLVVPRLLAEERLLASSPVYASYSTRVRYRLLPGVW